MSAVFSSMPPTVDSIAEHGLEQVMLLMFEPPIAFHRCFKAITGSVDPALMLTVACDASQLVPLNDDGWFVMSKVDWEEQTLLPFKRQLNARKTLIGLRLMSERRHGYPCVLQHKVNMQQVLEMLRKHADESMPRSRNAQLKGLQ